MSVSRFIAKRIKFKANLAVACITLSFLIMIIAVAVASGYRKEIRNGLRDMMGDIQISSRAQTSFGEAIPIEAKAKYLSHILEIPGVEAINEVVYSAGIVKNKDLMHGVLFKSFPTDTLEQTVNNPNEISIPEALASKLSLKKGDKLLSYFVGEKTKLRNFTIGEIYNNSLDSQEQLIVYADINTLRKINSWNENQVSAFEVILDSNISSNEDIRDINTHIGTLLYAYSDDSATTLMSTTTESKYPQLFDWLAVIDLNVLVILILMTIVAGFNMISGLLILLFEHVSTIGLLKSLGMTNRSISSIFLNASSSLIFKGMLIGNALAIAFCVFQQQTHFIKLDPQNYFVSFVPVSLDYLLILTADIVSFVTILLLLLIPCSFISRVDPAKTVSFD